MIKKRVKYKLIGFYEGYNNSEKLGLKLVGLDSSLCCSIMDIKFISKYLSKIDKECINKLVQCRG